MDSVLYGQPDPCELRKIPCPDRQDAVVDVVARIVQRHGACAVAVAIADKDERARQHLEKGAEILEKTGAAVGEVRGLLEGILGGARQETPEKKEEER